MIATAQLILTNLATPSKMLIGASKIRRGSINHRCALISASRSVTRARQIYREFPRRVMHYSRVTVPRFFLSAFDDPVRTLSPIRRAQFQKYQPHRFLPSSVPSNSDIGRNFFYVPFECIIRAPRYYSVRQEIVEGKLLD